MRLPVPRQTVQGLGWVTIVIFVVIALTEFRLGSLYHTALALGLAVLVCLGSRRQEVTWGTVALLVVLLIFGVYRAFTGLVLLR